MEVVEEDDMELTPAVSNNNPLLYSLVLRTLVDYIHPEDLLSFRSTCRKWESVTRGRFRKEAVVDLTSGGSGSGSIAARKVVRFIYALPSKNVGGGCPFGSFKVSELRLGVPSLDRAFSHDIAPHIRNLHLHTRQRVPPASFWNFFSRCQALEELDLRLPSCITAAPNHESSPFTLNNLWRVEWMKKSDDEDEEEEEDGRFSEAFIARFYSCVVRSLRHLTLPSEQSALPLRALTSFDTLEVLNFPKMSQEDVSPLLSCKSLGLSELRISSLCSDVEASHLNALLEGQSGSLRRLELGERIAIAPPPRPFPPPLEITLSSTMSSLTHLKICLDGGLKYPLVNFKTKFPVLQTLSLTLRGPQNESGDEQACFLEDFIQLPGGHEVEVVNSLTCLELMGCDLRSPHSLPSLAQLFPNVSSLSFGAPYKQLLRILWTLWPELKELRILTACPMIDEVLTGIPTPLCRKFLSENQYRVQSQGSCDEFLLQNTEGSFPSIRNLKWLQRLEVNTDGSNKLHSLSCLPSDISVFFGLLHLEELRSVVIKRSLISSEGSQLLSKNLPPWGRVEMEQIKFEYDQSVDAFQFHRNNARFIKLLCRYPHQSLHNLPSFLTSLRMEGRL